MATKKKEKRTLVSYKDIQIAYLMEGLDGVQQVWTDGNASKATIRRAVKLLQETSSNTAELERWVADNIGAIGRGRTAPKPGETRSYKAQQIKNGGPFLRLPLDSLGVIKGKVVRVRFEEDRIIVTR